MGLPKFLLSKTLPSGEVPRRRVLERKPIVTIKLPKMREEKKKFLWQPSCRSDWGGGVGREKIRIVAHEL